MNRIEAKNLINGQWQESVSGNRFESYNPADTREILGTAPRSTAEDVNHAARAAREAFESWRRMSRVKRGEYIDQLAQLIKRDLNFLSELVTRECGKPINEGRADVVEALHMTQYVAGMARMPHGEIIDSEIAEKDAYILRKPKGVVACITPWNFPVAIPLWTILPSLLEGNTVVFKPSEDTPLCAHKLIELFYEAGFPPGVINVVQGYGEDAGDALIHHPEVDVVVFTGSRAVGRYIQEECAKQHKFAAIEMGGKNAVIVLDDANLDIAVHAGILSAFKTSGQRCVSSNRMIVHEKLVDEFTQRFVAMAREINIGNGLNEDTFMGPLINEQGVQKYQHHNQKAIEEGAEVLLSGGRLQEGDLQYGHFVAPFVYRMHHRSDSFVLREEAFSPHVAIIPVSSLEEAVHVYNDTPYGLAMAVITEDYRKWRYIRDNCEFGVGYVNLPSIGAEVHLPFGGVKQSGNGHPSASALFDAVTHKVAFTVNHATEIKMAQGLSAKLR
ncbi:MAG: aldehyde dehydrogenase family protein [Fimbriimonadales bacterium]